MREKPVPINPDTNGLERCWYLHEEDYCIPIQVNINALNVNTRKIIKTYQVKVNPAYDWRLEEPSDLTALMQCFRDAIIHCNAKALDALMKHIESIPFFKEI